MHDSTFDHLKPTDGQMKVMEAALAAAKVYGLALIELLPDGECRHHPQPRWLAARCPVQGTRRTLMGSAPNPKPEPEDPKPPPAQPMPGQPGNPAPR